MDESLLFLGLILFIGIISKNQSIIIATIFVIILKLLPFTEKVMFQFKTKGINWGVLIITVAILIPIATKEIGFLDLLNAFKSPIGWVAILSGIGVSLLSARGVNLLSGQPEITVALVFGTIIGVVFMRGVAAGPFIEIGITYFALQIINIFFKK